MGGVQSGTHNLGEALWVQERQRQKCHREGSRYDTNSAQSTQDRRKLLKRTRSLAVISEDDSRQGGRDVSPHSQSTFDLSRKHQLIPRAKLIDRNSLKDRLSKSQQHLSDSYERFNEARSYDLRSTCGLHSIPGLASLPDPLSYPRRNRVDPDRLNILNWPDPPRRYRSVQNLDTVSGLVDIVEDNWPIEGNRSIDCIYTQVKRKRKEHRSLDNILFEDDGELEYFDVLNLLPLSNVRLEYDEADLPKDGGNFLRKNERGLKVFEYRETNSQGKNKVSPSTSNNATDEEKCNEHTVKEDNPAATAPDNDLEKLSSREDLDSEPAGGVAEPTIRCASVERDRRKFEKHSELEDSADRFVDRRTFSSSFKLERDHYGTVATDVESGLAIPRRETDLKIEEVGDYDKSVWISDVGDRSIDMSRRPQILKVIDNDVTRKCHHRGSIVEDVPRNGKRDAKGADDGSAIKLNSSSSKRNADVATTPPESAKTTTVEDTRNFFERKQHTAEREARNRQQNEGRFERIVKETSNILGKACNVVKGSLGFEARSESSDLGLGSESGSDSRGRSMDESAEDDRPAANPVAMRCGNDGKKLHTNLTRSRSCVDSIDFQDDDQEFDHVRYKIVKSRVFSKNMFTHARGDDVTYDGLIKYLREYSFQELLMDNNVVIIEPVRAEPVERRSSSSPLVRTVSTCKIAGTVQKKTGRNAGEQAGGGRAPKKQSSIRRHFFYHPIRVNRELIDEELPDPDTVKNVREMFENTLKKTKNASSPELSRDCKNGRSVSMRDLTGVDDDDGRRIDEEMSDKTREESRSRCSSKARDLTRLFETKSASSTTFVAKEELGRRDSKTRILAQTFEARSGNTSPSDSKSKVGGRHRNWDSGSVSSGVSSDYPDTDGGSIAHCTSSEDDEDANCNGSHYDADTSGTAGHYVSQDVLNKIRERGTSVTYYGGKVTNTHNGPLISPLIENGFERSTNDYVKFKLVKSNSCDSRLELTGRLVQGRSSRRRHARDGGTDDLRHCAIAELPSIEITADDVEKDEARRDEIEREPPMVIGLEPKREESNIFKADFKLGDSSSDYPSRYMTSALTRWETNANNWNVGNDFGKMEFEEFEVLEDSLNEIDAQTS